MTSSYTLGDHFEGFAKAMVSSGRYTTVSEVVRDGLRLMEKREQLREAKLRTLREAIREGFDSGPAEPLNMDEIIAEARQRRAATSIFRPKICIETA